jgi:predicted HD phosphohydrolase
MLSFADIELLFARLGSAQYSGEPVTQLEHALQTAHFAEQSGADDALVAACLLHDLGHLLWTLDRSGTARGGRSTVVEKVDAERPGAGAPHSDTPTLRGIDDTHQYYALPFLRGLLPDAVLDAIRLHVDAKRYLCAANPTYHARLSDDSKRSLALQGGVFDPADAARFLEQRGARDAVLLRQWDDLAKQADLATPPLAHFLERAARCAVAAAPAA